MRRDPSIPREPLPPAARKAALAGFVGTFIEYYDFALYGILTVYFSPLFFPADDPSTSLLTGLAVFGAGFVARPVGGIIFGRIGDRIGRRHALVASVVLMGVCSTLVALLPTYETLGIAAPILLVLLRLGQGISAGSEMLGSITYVLESVPRSRRVFMASLTPMGALAGGTVSSVVAAILAGTLGGEAMTSYGWRIAFLVAAPLTVFALIIRSRLDDSPEFAEIAAQREVVKTPLREIFRTHRRNLLIAGGIAMAANGAPNTAIWFNSYLVGERGIPGEQVFAASALMGLPIALLSPVAGRLSDRFGQRRVLVGVLIGYLVVSLPVLHFISSANGVLQLVLVIGSFGILGALVQAPAFSYIAELFPARVRYTGANFGQNIGTVFGSGIAPFVAAVLVAATGSTLAPALWIAAVCLIAFAALTLRATHYIAGTNSPNPTPDPAQA